QADLACREGVEQLYREVQDTSREHGQGVYALVLNAGVGVSGDFVRENSFEDEMNLLAINVIAPVHLCKLILPDMVRLGEGRVLITSSVAALMPGPYFATYAASKAFLLSFAEAL